MSGPLPRRSTRPSKMRDGAAEKDLGGFTVQVFKREADNLLLWRHIWN